MGELALARRHERALAARGGRRVEGDAYALIVAVHVLFFLAAAAEFAWSPRATVAWWTAPVLLVFLAGQALRWSAIVTLGDRWTTRVWVVPGEPPVRRGPFRFVRHPNYVGVALELLAFPLAFGLVGTAVLATGLNALALSRRIAREDAALAAAAPRAREGGVA